MFVEHHEEYEKKLFNEKYDTQDVLEEVEKEMKKSKYKNKEGVARLKAKADLIWRGYIKPDTHQDFKSEVFKMFDQYHTDIAENNSEAQAEKEEGSPAQKKKSDAADEDEGDEGDEGDNDDNDEDEPAPKPKKGRGRKAKKGK